MTSLKKIIYCVALSSFCCFAEDMLPQIQDSMGPVLPGTPSFTINNRSLVRVNGKVISLMDVVKKMDMVIHQYFPDTRNSPISLFQFYNSQWKRFLEEIVFNELMLADAEVKEIQISDGDVREEMQQRFGPNIIATLSSLGLQYEEVRKLVHSELVVRQIQWMKIYSRAQQSVTPERIKKDYIAYCNTNPTTEEWEYQVITFRGNDANTCKNAADLFSQDLKLDSTKLHELISNERYSKDPSVSVNISKDYKVNSKNISEQHKNVLVHLKENTFSDPIYQTSRTDQSAVYRIFYLKSLDVKLPVSFEKMHNEIKNSLVEKAIQEEKHIYEQKLAQKFGFSSSILKDIVADDYQPFALR